MGLLDTIVGAAKGYVFSGGNPLGAVAGAAASGEQQRAERKIKRQVAAQQAKERELMAMDFGMGTSRPTFVDPYKDQLVVNAGNGSSGGFFDTVRSGLREVGGFVSDAFSSGIPQLFGVTRPRGVGQQPAITTVTNVGAQESQGSGSIQAGMGAALPSVLAAGRGLLKNPLGQLALGGGAAAAISGFGGQKTILSQIKKVKSISAMLKKHKKNIYLEVDGGVNPLNIKNLVKSGANLIVAGNAIFKDGKDFYEKNIRALKVPRVK